MENSNTYLAQGRRGRSALMVFCAVVLFLAGLLLLLAPGPIHSEPSCRRQMHFPRGVNGRIMSAQFTEPASLAGG